MDYTTSIDNVVHGGTGRRMHSDSIAIPTAWSGNDSNMLIWSLMEVLRLAGISGKAFNPDDPVSYTRFRDALTALFARLDSPAFTGSPQVPVPPQFDNTTKVAPTSFVQRALGNFQAVSAYTGDQQLAASQSGSVINFWGGAPSTFTLPSCSAMPPAGAFLFNNSGSAPVTIARAGSDAILCNGGNPGIVVGPGDNLLLGAMGQKQAAIDTAGNVVAFYDTVDSPAPEDVSTVDITDTQWAKMLAAQATGKRLVITETGKLSLLPLLPPTPEQIVAQNANRRAELLEQASVALAPLQMAVSLGDATDDEKEAARQWVTFTRAVKAVDLTGSGPVWPSKPEIAGAN